MKKRWGIPAIAAAVALGAHGLAQERTIERPYDGGQQAHTKYSPGSPLQGAQPSGQAAFDRVCKTCHGPEARGDAAPRLVPFSREDEELLGIVREGIGQMPPISPRELQDESVAQIAAYLRSLSR